MRRQPAALRAALQRALLQAWTHRGFLATLLWPVSMLFSALVAFRRGLYRSGLLTAQRVDVPVLVVGNLVAGGGGKTPLVIALVAHLRQRGINVGVLSRGYGRQTRCCREVRLDSTPSDVGDEPVLIHRRTGAPVYVANRRIDAARALLQRHPDVTLLVCDDGLQHHQLHRDIEIGVFDRRGVGNGWLLPAGPLREAWPRPIDLVVVADAGIGLGGFQATRSLASHAHRADGSTVALDELAGHGASAKPLWAVAAIAQPEAFFAMLRERGVELAETLALPDHAPFNSAGDLPPIGGQTLLCTEKDAYKLWRHRPDALAVPMLLHLEPAFWSALEALLQARTGAKLSSPHGQPTS